MALGGNVWTQLYALAAGIASPLLGHLNSLKDQSSGGELPSVPENAADLTSTSSNATSLEIKMIRTQATKDGIFGEMTINDRRVCFTMENLTLAIPEGSYDIEIYDSPHAGRPLPLLQNVPGRELIEIHCGNVPQDSKGCIIVGMVCTGDTLERSREAFNILFPLISEAAQRRITISSSF